MRRRSDDEGRLGGVDDGRVPAGILRKITGALAFGRLRPCPKCEGRDVSDELPCWDRAGVWCRRCGFAASAARGGEGRALLAWATRRLDGVSSHVIDTNPRVLAVDGVLHVVRWRHTIAHLDGGLAAEWRRRGIVAEMAVGTAGARLWEFADGTISREPCRPARTPLLRRLFR